MLVEVGVLAFGDLFGRASPYRLHRVEDFVLDRDDSGGLLFNGPAEIVFHRFALAAVDDGIADKIRVSSYDSRQNPSIGDVFNPVFFVHSLLMKSDGSPAHV